VGPVRDYTKIAANIKAQILQGVRLLCACLTLLAVLLCQAHPAGAFDPPSQERLERILAEVDAYVPEVLARTGVPGLSVALVAEDKVVFLKGYGTRTQNGSLPVTPDTVFQIGSCSKAFTAARVGMLVDQGALGWNDRVVRHLPQFAMSSQWITDAFVVDDLMAHRSGLYEYAGDYEAFLGYSRSHMIHSLRYFQPESSFRTEYAYQNGFFLVAAALIEAFSGQSYEEAIRQGILEPLGMNHTTISEEGYLAAENRAAMYAPTADRSSINRIPDDWRLNPWCYLYAPAGGINSNARDMAQWVRLNLGAGSYEGRRLLDSATLAWIYTPHTLIPQGFYSRNGWDAYCLGWFYTPGEPFPSIQHGGNTLGHHSLVSLVPQARVGAVVLTNTGVNLAAEAVAWRFIDLYLDRTLRDVFQKSAAAIQDFTVTRPLPQARQTTLQETDYEDLAGPAPFCDDAYSGTYYNHIYGRVSVIWEGSELVITIGPQQIKMPLEYQGEAKFKLNWPDELYINGQVGQSLVRFEGLATGKARRMIVDIMNYDKGGEFVRIGD
jgi:CubicO group peptidase (beta-lactamase class C family)